MRTPRMTWLNPRASRGWVPSASNPKGCRTRGVRGGWDGVQTTKNRLPRRCECCQCSSLHNSAPALNSPENDFINLSQASLQFIVPSRWTTAVAPLAIVRCRALHSELLPIWFSRRSISSCNINCILFSEERTRPSTECLCMNSALLWNNDCVGALLAFSFSNLSIRDGRMNHLSTTSLSWPPGAACKDTAPRSSKLNV